MGWEVAMDLNELKGKLREDDHESIEALWKMGREAMQKQLTKLMQVHPALKVMEPTLPSWMEVVNLLIVQSYLKGQSTTMARQAARLDKMSQQRDVAMRIAEDGIAARERIFGKTPPGE